MHPSILLLALACLGAATAARLEQTPTPLTMLTDPLARCLDGTLSGYYHQPAASAADATRWVIFLEGGGECASQTACTDATRTPLGSSTHFYPSITFGPGHYLANANATANPDFATWHHVDVPYCSQDLFSGQRTDAPPSTWGLYFSGHRILAAVINALERDAGLASATEIVFSGVSAGGIGMWLNANWCVSIIRRIILIAFAWGARLFIQSYITLSDSYRYFSHYHRFTVSFFNQVERAPAQCSHYTRANRRLLLFRLPLHGPQSHGQLPRRFSRAGVADDHCALGLFY